MPIMQWNVNYSVNIKEIDEQHKRLIDLINDLHDAMKIGQGKDAMGNVLNELADYTLYHFGTEEKLFERYKYLELPEHKKQHDDLTKQVLDLKAKLDKGQSLVTVEIMGFLKDWLNNHILKSDKKYGAFLNGKGVS